MARTTLNDPYWLAAAKALPVGGHKKVQCQCSPKRAPSLMLNHRDDGYSAWCFRCEKEGGGWVAKRLTIRERLALLRRHREADEAAQGSTFMGGTDDLSQWPDAAVTWLLKAGISMRTAVSDIGIRWNVETGRLVIPVYNGGDRMVWYNARAFDRDPKYLSPRRDKGRTLAEYGSGDVLVITEDILSAWKVAEHDERVTAVSILGTKLKDATINALLDKGMDAVTWLDPDEAGQTNARKIRKRLRAMGLNVGNVISAADPKNVDGDTIRSLITKEMTWQSR